MFMRPIITTALSMLLFSQVLLAQVEVARTAEPYVEVNGHADTMVIPDEIYILVFISERMEGKEKITLEVQEKQLIEKLREKGVNIDDLSMSGGRADYVKFNWHSKRDVLKSHEYELLVHTAEEVGKVFEAVDELDLQTCRIARVDHSQRKQLEKEMRIAAMKDAAYRADYMLEAVGAKRGTPLVVNDQLQQRPDLLYARGVEVTSRYQAGNASMAKGKVNGTVAFQKIRIESHIYSKFSIE